jgi:subtilisin-like proprotein convertase family protein
LTDLRSPNLDLGTVSFTFNVAATNIFANSNAITIPDHGPGNPYPSIITISNLPGIITKVTATVSGLTHSFARDVNILLVNPAGGSVKLMSHTSGAHAVTNATLTFDDAAAQALPGTGQIYDGTYYPTSYLGSVTFNSPAPSGSYGTAMNALNSVSPNGQWSLYVLDDAAGDSGNIANGWSLKISTLSPLNPVSDRLSISRIGITSQSLLTLSGLSVHGYQLLISSNLTSWTPVMTGTTAPNGTIQLTITNALNRQYYRSLRLP